jgi:dTDP-glucose 4,6-dehydratase
MSRSFETLLVTGGCGFIGANFIRYLFEESGYAGRVVNLDKLTYAGNPLSLADVAEQYSERYAFYHEDICDRDAVRKILQDEKIDAIVHFAAESHVDRSIDAPDSFIQTNINGTHSLIELAREVPDQIKLFHHVSTDEVFGSLGEEGFFTEETPYAPNSPYSASKAASDHLVRAYHETFGLPTTMSNCSNNYGPYQFPEKLVPLVILNACAGKALPIYGDGMYIRDWLYVRDHCTAIWKIMQDGILGQTYNVGGRNELPNLEVVDSICDLVDQFSDVLPSGPRRDLKTFVKDRPGHDRRYAIDCSKMERELGWLPEESFKTGLEKTVRWNLDNGAWIDQIQSGEYLRWIEQQYEN